MIRSALVLGVGIASCLVFTSASPAGASGTTWSIVPTANASTSAFNGLESITCVTAGDCWAVGSATAGPGPYDSRTLAEHWNGESWSLVATPNPSSSTLNAFNGVTCVSSTDCWATGLGNGTSTIDQTLAEHWNGTSWTIVASPSPSPVSILGGVACVTGSDCWTVGHAGGQNLAEHWNGTAWSVVTVADTSPSQHNELGGVACITTSDCWAVGDAASGSGGTEQTLAEHWNGTSWTVVTTANTNPSQSNGLANITCLSTSSCWSVGFAENGTGGAQQTLAEQWNGSAWAIAASADTSSSQNNYLESVSCVSTAGCWAVGSAASGAGGTFRTLAEQLNGSAWSIAATPNAGTAQNVLGGVSCLAASDCWAVGSAATGTGGALQTLAEHGTGPGYFEVASDGGIFNFGGAGFFGSMGGIPLNKPVVGIAATPDGQGYWEVASDGGIFNFGDAGFFGSMGGMPLNEPVVGIAATPDGKGYWEVASDGGIFNFGDARYFGSEGGVPLNKPVVGIAASPDGQGYWGVASDGGIFNFGDAGFLGSMGGMALNAPVVGIAATPDGQGYWEAASDGGIFNFGDAGYFGSMGGMALNAPIVGIAAATS